MVDAHISNRGSWVEIDTSALRQNYRIYKNCIASKYEITAVVKANAYGHGDVKVAKAMQEEGVEHFAVATIVEAIKLRHASISCFFYKGSKNSLRMFAPVSTISSYCQYIV